ncbi:MAG: NAD(P)-dependent oxidoreductase [Methanobrevibacter sp.]|nr:NAD(P)-dependent oxidoreductase [Methanobrevibacter sp.]
MKFGFIGFGEVSYTLSKILLSYGFEVLSSEEGRSKKTKKLMNSLDITILDSLKDVALESDILISANSPQNALAVAVEYGSLTKGIFLDFNNISPNTARQIADYIPPEHFIDSAIMGKVSSNELNLFFSGKNAREFVDDMLELANRYKKSIIDEGCDFESDVKVNIQVVSDEIGDVSSLKTLRSSYTKGVSAILVETFETAQKLGLEDDLWKVLSLTENRDFETASKSRINSSYKASHRRFEELKEILEFLDNIDDDEDSKIMAMAIKDKFEYLKDKN